MTAHVTLLCSVFVMAILPRAVSETECAYPCWTQIPARNFTYESFQAEPLPPVVPPYEFSLPHPSQSEGAYSADCNALENPSVDLYQYNPATQNWTGLLTALSIALRVICK